MPNRAATNSVMPDATFVDAALAFELLDGAPEDVLDAPLEAAEPEDVGAVPVGTPKADSLLVKGPGPDEADAPLPTSRPSPWPELPECACAAAWKAVKVLLPDPGALMAL